MQRREFMLFGGLSLAALALPPFGRAIAAEQLLEPVDRGLKKALADVALTVRAGEVVGIAGVSGNGQSELLRALSGKP